MKILVAPNSMKGSLNAFDFAKSVEKAFIECSDNFEIKTLPVADGGDFTGEVLSKSLGAKEIAVEALDPFGKKIQSKYSISGKCAIIEMADASGMKLVDNDMLNPLKASSYGTGQLIQHAISNGCSNIFLAIGGSATVDGGMGMAEALGFSYFTEDGRKLHGNGKNLSDIHNIILPKLPGNVSFKIICDVDNPLLGSNGAASVFGPQKGATTEMVELLEDGLKNWSEILEKKSGQRLAKREGAGAAGGIAIPLLAYFNAEIVPGADFILVQLQFSKYVRWADLIITGEGKIDSQTLNNKAPWAVAKQARKQNKPIIAIGGKVEPESMEIFDGVYSLTNGPMLLEYAMENAEELVYSLSKQLAKTISVFNKE